MQKIIELLEWYQQNSNNSLDDMVGIELVKLNSLYDMYENHTDEMFVEEMIESFCKIIEKQRAKIEELEAEAYAQNGAAQRGFSKVGGTANMAYIKSVVQEQEGQPIGEYTNDTQLQEDFVQFCMNSGKGKSLYTINDYCLRVKNLWKAYYNASKAGEIPQEYALAEDEQINPRTPLLNAYNHSEELYCYISGRIASEPGNRNLANTRAAFNKFDDFKIKTSTNR